MPAMAGLGGRWRREVVEITGDGLRMSVVTLREFLGGAPQLRHELERFAILLGFQIAQTAGCNPLPDVEQRLARWLLIAPNRVGSPSPPITHDFLATPLRTNSPTLTLTPAAHQK